MTRSILLPVVIIKSKNSFNAMSPKVPGCVAIDKTVEKVLTRFSKAVALHIKNDGRARDKLSQTRPYTTLSKYIKEYGTDSLYTFIKIKIKG